MRTRNTFVVVASAIKPWQNSHGQTLVAMSGADINRLVNS